MQLYVIKNDRIIPIILPSTVYGNYWIYDVDKKGKKINLVNVTAKDNSWEMISNDDIDIEYNGKEESSIVLELYKHYYLIQKTKNEKILIYVTNVYEPSYADIKLTTGSSFTVGSTMNTKNHICFPAECVEDQHAMFICNNGVWAVKDLNSKYGTYVNKKPVKECLLRYGDVVFIMGLKLVFMKDFITINNPNNLVKIPGNYFQVYPQKEREIATDSELDLSSEEIEFFNRKPRFRLKSEIKEVGIDSPPPKVAKDETPAIYTIGPAVTTSMSSLTMSMMSLMQYSQGGASLKSMAPTLITAVALLLSSFLWPTLSRKYQRKQEAKKEKEREVKYREFLEEKRRELISIANEQKNILLQNSITLEKCIKIINTKADDLWNMEKYSQDFLHLRIGIGNVPLDAHINYASEGFTLEDDELKKEMLKIVEENKMIKSVPIIESFVDKNITGIIGHEVDTDLFIRGLLLQMITLHSYEDLKIVILTNEKNKEKWEIFKALPFCWDDEKRVQFFSTNGEEAKEVINHLDLEYQKREGNENSYKSYGAYYVIITDDYRLTKSFSLFDKIIDSNVNKGFSFLVISKTINHVPTRCKAFISVGEKTSGIFENELTSDKQKLFVADRDNIDFNQIVKILANIPIDLQNYMYDMPNMITFLDMYQVGRIEQLNPINRWKTNNPALSLQAPIGIDTNGDLFKLDLHEKYHGPHGLIAGMTGSGKSEFIITYILSMALNYDPCEVQFVLIDYKGGGLVGAFENRDTGVHLPHLAGAITNLDISEINRALASIQSELKRRQAIFNSARDKLNEGTIDIYKYQKYYREGILNEPVSHLFIISDEFAELKVQQPEFMDQLISTARIGRSLGVHLILATQKPSGVVNDQIWSNSRFRVCLKVQESSDSQEMIKCPDAAGIKQVGRFYLQVGYNEFFALGQSAWCGAQYVPTEKMVKKIDDSINFVNNVGSSIKTISNNKANKGPSLGEQLPNIVKYLCGIAKQENINVRKLWLDKIPAIIYSDNLAKKYNYKIQKWNLNPIIGEYDNPEAQQQNILTLPLTDGGNALVYGTSAKDMFASAVIYSTITTHTADEVNMYVLDFDTEVLKMFKNAPQIGDVVFQNETEKVNNLFRFLSDEIKRRQKMFSDYNGSYKFYCESSGNTVPIIIVIINGFEVFTESYEPLLPDIQRITRDGHKYGVVFIVSASSENGVRYNIRQNFQQMFTLQMNNTDDYIGIFGSRVITPSKEKGRGLVRLDKVYEYQTASLFEETKTNEIIKNLCIQLRNNAKSFAKNIPILPDIVDIDFVRSEQFTLENVPVGIETDSLNIGTLDFKKKAVMVISTEDTDLYLKFIPNLMKLFVSQGDTAAMIIDADKIFEKEMFQSQEKNIYYYSENLEETYPKVYDLLSKQNSMNVILFITGLANLQKAITDSSKSFESLVEKMAETTNSRIVLLEPTATIRDFTYESWYKKNVNPKNGLWIGEGLGSSSVFTTKADYKLMTAPVEKGFGYLIKNGRCIKVKLLGARGEEEE